MKKKQQINDLAELNDILNSSFYSRKSCFTLIITNVKLASGYFVHRNIKTQEITILLSLLYWASWNHPDSLWILTLMIS